MVTCRQVDESEIRSCQSTSRRVIESASQRVGVSASRIEPVDCSQLTVLRSRLTVGIARWWVYGSLLIRSRTEASIGYSRELVHPGINFDLVRMNKIFSFDYYFQFSPDSIAHGCSEIITGQTTIGFFTDNTGLQSVQNNGTDRSLFFSSERVFSGFFELIFCHLGKVVRAFLQSSGGQG